MSIYEDSPAADGTAPGGGGGGGASKSSMAEELSGSSGAKDSMCLGQDFSDEATQKKVGGVTAVAVVLLIIYAFASDFEWETSSSQPPSAQHGVVPTTTGANGEIVFIPPGNMRKLSAGMEHASVAVPLDYQIDFDLVPGPTIIDDWSNIIHLTATGQNCCEYGDRVPGVWFRPGNRQLYIVDGHGGLDHNGGTGNAECTIANDLEVGRQYKISIQMRQKVVEAFLADCGPAGTVQCAQEPQLRCTEKREDRITFPHAQVFASDTFYTPADASIDNFYMKTLAPVRGCTDFAACNHNAQASEDDGSCQRPRIGADCAGHQTSQTPCQLPPGQFAPPPPPAFYVPGAPPPPPPCMKTQFIPPMQPMQLVKGRTLGAHEGEQGAYAVQPSYGQQAFHAVVSVPLDYTVSFTITPSMQVRKHIFCAILY